MSIYDELMKRFERGKDGKLKFRMFAGAKGGRLTNDWGAGGTSQDSELLFKRNSRYTFFRCIDNRCFFVSNELSNHLIVRYGFIQSF